MSVACGGPGDSARMGDEDDLCGAVTLHSRTKVFIFRGVECISESD